VLASQPNGGDAAVPAAAAYDDCALSRKAGLDHRRAQLAKISVR
jgi:hypothetical protein